MDNSQYISQWLIDHPVAYVVMKYLVIVLVVVLLIQFIRRYLKRKILDASARYKTQKGIEIIGYILMILISITYFTGNIKDFTLAIGLFSAGVAFTLQELILSVAGSLYIFLVKVYKPGDRIQINGIKGDVIDIDSIYTTMMEIGEWVSSDNYSGRIVKLSNAFVFKGPIYNYSMDFPFIWDEFDLPIRYGSDIEETKRIMTEVAVEVLSQYTLESNEKWREVVEKFYIENAQLDPTLALTLTDNWIQMNLRYIVDFKKRRGVKHQLNDKIREAIDKTEGRVIIASSTFEVVRIPIVKLGDQGPTRQ